MIKIFLSLGANASLGGSLLPNRGVNRLPITPVDNITYHVGDVLRVSWSLEANNHFSADNSVIETYGDFNTYKIVGFNFVVNDNGSTYTPVYNTNYDFLSYTHFSFLYFYWHTTNSLYYIEMSYEDFTGENYYDFILSYPLSNAFSGYFDFEIIDSRFTLSEEAYSEAYTIERIKEGGSYTPPQKSNLYTYIYDFYYSLFNEGDLTAITISGLNNMPFDSWLCHTLTIITLITGIFILFLLLRWLFKVISGFILLK